MKKALSLILALVLCLSLCACGGQLDGLIEKIPGLGSPEETYNPQNNPFPVPETRPIEDIQATGITAEDVLAEYDRVALLALNSFILRISDNEEGFDWKYLSAQFSSLNVSQENMPTSNGTWDLQYEPFHRASNNKYCLQFNYQGSFKNEPESLDIISFYISKEEFENILNAYNIKSFQITEEYLNSLGPMGKEFYSYCININTTVYEPFQLTRELIQTSTEEQLWALYNARNSIYALNQDRMYDPQEEVLGND